MSLVAVFVPTRWEAKSLVGALDKPVPQLGYRVPTWRTGNTLIFQTGMGRDSIRKILPEISSDFSQIWLIGCCGGVDSELQTGDIVVGSSTWTSDGRRVDHVPPNRLENDLKIVASDQSGICRTGAIRFVDRVLDGPDEKKRLIPALCVEMEAGEIAGWAKESGIEFIHIRIVLDPVDSHLPQWSWKKMIRLHRQAKAYVSFRRQLKTFDRVNRSVCRMLQEQSHLFQ